MTASADLVARQQVVPGPDAVCYTDAREADLYARRPFAAGPDVVAYPSGYPAVPDSVEIPPPPPAEIVDFLLSAPYLGVQWTLTDAVAATGMSVTGITGGPMPGPAPSGDVPAGWYVIS